MAAVQDKLLAAQAARRLRDIQQQRMQSTHTLTTTASTLGSGSTKRLKTIHASALTTTTAGAAQEVEEESVASGDEYDDEALALPEGRRFRWYVLTLFLSGYLSLSLCVAILALLFTKSAQDTTSRSSPPVCVACLPREIPRSGTDGLVAGPARHQIPQRENTVPRLLFSKVSSLIFSICFVVCAFDVC